MRKPALCASLAVLALSPGASGQPQATSPGVLLSKHWLGVYRLVPSGAIQRLVGTDIRPLAVSADGDAAGVRASDKQQNGPLFIARGPTRVELPHSSGGVWCVAFSADGSLVTYISGKAVLTEPSPQLFYFRIAGTLWLADVAHPQEARAIDTGAFTLSECPLPAPTGQRFAYFVQTSSGDWELRLYRNGAVETIADDPAPVPSNHDRSYAWAPNGTLGFTRGDDLWAGRRRIATNLTTTLAPRPNIRYAKAIDFSSDGRLLAVSVGDKTGIFKPERAVRPRRPGPSDRLEREQGCTHDRCDQAGGHRIPAVSAPWAGPRSSRTSSSCRRFPFRRALGLDIRSRRPRGSCSGGRTGRCFATSTWAS